MYMPHALVQRPTRPRPRVLVVMCEPARYSLPFILVMPPSPRTRDEGVMRYEGVATRVLVWAARASSLARDEAVKDEAGVGGSNGGPPPSSLPISRSIRFIPISTRPTIVLPMPAYLVTSHLVSILTFYLWMLPGLSNHLIVSSYINTIYTIWEALFSRCSRYYYSLS